MGLFPDVLAVEPVPAAAFVPDDAATSTVQQLSATVVSDVAKEVVELLPLSVLLSTVEVCSAPV
jgi:hypothetical protein